MVRRSSGGWVRSIPAARSSASIWRSRSSRPGWGRDRQVVVGDRHGDVAVDHLDGFVGLFPGHAGAQDGGAVGDVLPGLAEGGGVGDAVQQELGLAEVEV